MDCFNYMKHLNYYDGAGFEDAITDFLYEENKDQDDKQKYYDKIRDLKNSY